MSRQYAEEQERGRALLLRLEEQRDEISRRNERAAGLEAQRAVLQNDISHHEHSIEEAKDAIEQAGRSQEELSAELAAAGEKLLEQKEKLAAANEQAEANCGPAHRAGRRAAPLCRGAGPAPHPPGRDL